MSNPWGVSPQGGRRGQGPNPRTVLWIIAAVAVVAILVRTNHLSSFSVLAFVAFVPSIVIHEVAHGVVADALGDPTARREGRLTLNPLKHIDPFGTILIPALMALTTFGVLGWAKQVPWTRSRLRHPQSDSVVVALVGPAVNIALALVFLLAYRFVVPLQDKFGFTSLIPGPLWAQFIFVAGYINALLAVLYLIPLPPLDGSTVVERFLTPQQQAGYERIRPFTIFVPLAIFILYPQGFDRIFDPALTQWARLVGI